MTYIVKYLLNNHVQCESMGQRAYETITMQWNAENATERFLLLAKTLLDGKSANQLFADGVCSTAEILEDDWYK